MALKSQRPSSRLRLETEAWVLNAISSCDWQIKTMDISRSGAARAMSLDWDAFGLVMNHLSESKADLSRLMRTCRTLHILGIRPLVARFCPTLIADDAMVKSLRPPQYDLGALSTSSAWQCVIGFLQMLIRDAPTRAGLLEVFIFPHTSANNGLQKHFTTLLAQVLRHAANMRAITIAFSHLPRSWVSDALGCGCPRLRHLTLVGDTSADGYAVAVAMLLSTSWDLRSISIRSTTPGLYLLLKHHATSLAELCLSSIDTERLPYFPSVRTLRIEHPSLIDRSALVSAFPSLEELFIRSDFARDDDARGNVNGWRDENETHTVQWTQLDFLQGDTPYTYALAMSCHIRRVALDVFIESQGDADRLVIVLSASQPTVLSLDIQFDNWESFKYLEETWDTIATMQRLRCLSASFYAHESNDNHRPAVKEGIQRKLVGVNVKYLHLHLGSLFGELHDEAKNELQQHTYVKPEILAWLTSFVAEGSPSLIFLAAAMSVNSDCDVTYFSIVREVGQSPQVRRLEKDEGEHVYVQHFS